jgi:hypothetical protein
VLCFNIACNGELELTRSRAFDFIDAEDPAVKRSKRLRAGKYRGRIEYPEDFSGTHPEQARFSTEFGSIPLGRCPCGSSSQAEIRPVQERQRRWIVITLDRGFMRTSQ